MTDRTHFPVLETTSRIRVLAPVLLATVASSQAQLSYNGSLAFNGATPFQSPTWNHQNNLFVGYQANGSLTISSGGTVSNAGGGTYIGVADGATGLIDVTGGTFNDSGWTFVGGGDGGSGTLRVRNDGTVNVSRIDVGNIIGSTGLVELTGGSITCEYLLNVDGTTSVSGGTLNITDTLETYSAFVSPLLDIHGTGTVNVDVAQLVCRFNLRESGVFNTRNAYIDQNQPLIEVSGGTWVNTGDFVIAGSGRGMLTISGGSVTTSTVFMAPINNSSAQLRLNGGVLTTGAINEGIPPFQPDGSGTISFDGGTLRLSRNSSNLFSLFETGDITLESGGGTLDTQGFAISTNYGFSGVGRLDKEGSGTLTMGGMNTYAGGTIIEAGTLAVTGSIHHPDAFLDVSGTLRISGSGSVTNSVGRVGRTAPGRVEMRGGSWNNGSTLFVGSFYNGTMEITGGDVTTPASVFLGNFFTTGAKGDVLLNGGRLTALQVEEGPGGGTLRFGGGTLRLAGNQNALFNSFESGDITLEAGGGTIDTQGFAVASNYGLSGAGGLIKTGSGTLTLTGANTFAGQTRIQEGTLSLGTTGSLNGSSAIDIAAGVTFDVSGLAGGFTLGASQSLSGNGTILGNVTTAGTIAPGNSTGKLKFTGDLQLDSAAMIQMEIASLSDFDRILVESNLIYGGTLTLSFLDGYLPTDGDSFDLFQSFTSQSGSFDDITMPVSGFTAHFDYASGQLTFVAVPEVHAPLLIGLAVIGSLAIRSRKQS